MTTDQLDTAYRAFCRRRPFRAFLIEFTSGHQLLIGHPEAVRNEAHLYAMRCPDGGTWYLRPKRVSIARSDGADEIDARRRREVSVP